MKRKILTVLRWMQVAGLPTTPKVFFQYGYGWKYGVIDNTQVIYCVNAFLTTGYVPEYMVEFMRRCVYPTLLAGGKNAILIDSPPA